MKDKRSEVLSDKEFEALLEYNLVKFFKIRIMLQNS